MRIVFVGIFWSIFFLEGIRVIMLTNWHFDILRPRHWEFAWNLWTSGWVIDDIKEWAFVLIILTFIPLWLTGWAALSVIKWGKIFAKIIFFPLGIFNKVFETPVKIIANTASVKAVKKKKSYKEIRPKSIRAPIDDSALSTTAEKAPAKFGAPKPQSGIRGAAPAKAPAAEPKKFDHSLFQFDDSEDFDFNFDEFDEKSKAPEETPVAEKPKAAEKPAAPAKGNRNNNNNAQNNQNNNRNNKSNRNTPISAPKTEELPVKNANNTARSSSTLDIIRQKGYEVIQGATIKNTLIDFIGVADDQLCICLTDKEPGDWLADEERFNDEEPLWFSESSHRISPVRKADVARLILTEKLADAELDFKVTTYVIEQIGNIINAEDMFEIWDGMDINVTRIDRGTPKELKLFAKALEDANKKVEKDKFEKVKKLIRSIA